MYTICQLCQKLETAECIQIETVNKHLTVNDLNKNNLKSLYNYKSLIRLLSKSL